MTAEETDQFDRLPIEERSQLRIADRWRDSEPSRSPTSLSQGLDRIVARTRLADGVILWDAPLPTQSAWPELVQPEPPSQSWECLALSLVEPWLQIEETLEGLVDRRGYVDLPPVHPQKH
jgi:hypothetical protein